MGRGGALGGEGALAAGAGAGAAFSFFTLEAGFLGMVPCTRLRRCPWGGARRASGGGNARSMGSAAFASVRRRAAGAGARKGEG
jgi:hypothetical protein